MFGLSTNHYILTFTSDYVTLGLFVIISRIGNMVLANYFMSH